MVVDNDDEGSEVGDWAMCNVRDFLPTSLDRPPARPSGQAAGDSSPLPPLRIRLGDDDEWEEMLEEHEEWLDENGHKLVERVIAKGRKNRGLCTHVVTCSRLWPFGAFCCQIHHVCLPEVQTSCFQKGGPLPGDLAALRQTRLVAARRK